jgi:hypothetical protein
MRGVVLPTHAREFFVVGWRHQLARCFFPENLRTKLAQIRDFSRISIRDISSDWVPQATAFFALVSEDGGRLGVGALRFVDLLASHAGTSVGERRAL